MSDYGVSDLNNNSGVLILTDRVYNFIRVNDYEMISQYLLKLVPGKKF
jgi:hypothetical protein